MVEGSLVVSRVLRCDEDGLVPGLPPEEVHRRALEARRMLGRAQRALSFWLVEVERRELFRQFGCSNVFQYAELHLELAPHTIAEHLRLGKELEHLPKLAEAVARGEVAPSKAREISRVATAETEELWVGVGSSSTYRQVEKMVALTPKGGLPREGSAAGRVACREPVCGDAVLGERVCGAGELSVSTAAGDPAAVGGETQASAALESGVPVGPSRYRSKLVVDVENDQMAVLESALEKARRQTGSRDRSELLVHIARVFLEGGGEDRDDGVPYRITLHSHPGEQLAWVEGNDGASYVPASTVEEAMCDCEILALREDAASLPELEILHSSIQDERANCPARDEMRERGPRLRRTIPPTLRRKVRERDGCCCTVPGCRNRRYLHIHHIDPLWKGGADKAANLTLVCSRHHRMLHRGELSVKGRAPDALEWRDGSGRPLAVSPDGELPHRISPQMRFSSSPSLHVGPLLFPQTPLHPSDCLLP